MAGCTSTERLLRTWNLDCLYSPASTQRYGDGAILPCYADTTCRPEPRPIGQCHKCLGPPTPRRRHLLGYDKCFELVNVDQLKDKFNAHLEGKLLILVDDIQQLSKKAQQNLKTTCTQKNFKLENKGIDSYLVKAYYDVILTSNDEKSLWVDNEDRRSEIVQVNTKYKNNGDESKTRFWKEFNDGLGDMCLMKQYWEFFASYQHRSK